MTVNEMIQELRVLRDRLVQAALIEGTAHDALARALATLEAQKARGTQRPWSFSIPSETPLLFRKTAKSQVKYELMIDLYGLFSQPDNGVPTDRHHIVVRVWATKRNCWFNEHLDSAELDTLISNGLRRRVMLRFRFDYATPDLDEPWFHLQVGGQQSPDEFFRLPENLGVPRFHHNPMNLILACEFVIRHFYPEDYAAIASEPTWKGAIRTAQENYLERFLEKMRAFDTAYSYLDHCWTET